jgi:hypothetical protein
VLGVLVLGDAVPNNFFKGCSAMTELDLGTRLARIGDCAFASCTRLRHVRLPDTVTALHHHAFADCTDLETARLPARMRRIPAYAFIGCPRLREVTFPAEPGAFGSADAIAGTLPATLRMVGHGAFTVGADLPAMFPHVKLTPGLPPTHDTAFLMASVEGGSAETAALLLQIRALRRGAGTVYGVAVHAGGRSVCVSGCVDTRERTDV